MRLPRNAKIYRGHLDVTPFAGVFFCLLIFVLLGSLVYTPGVLIRLPEADGALPGVAGPVVQVAVGPNGQFYFENQPIQDLSLEQRLKTEVSRQGEPLTLLVLADKDVTTEKWARLFDLAKRAGIKQIQEALLPRPFDARPKPLSP
jgi:biopolymer transport protein ExbD